MFESLSHQLIAAIQYLLPGFLCAWVFYGLTSHPKPSQFERLVQALIFTFIIRTMVEILRTMFEYIGANFLVIGSWSELIADSISILIALSLGLLFAYCVNSDGIHKFFRKLSLTTRTSHPSEWFYTFSEKVTFVILHMKDGRRLYGWPKEWPIEPHRGQFYIMLPAWILDDGNQDDLSELDGILVQATDVKWVEFLREEGEKDE